MSRIALLALAFSLSGCAEIGLDCDDYAAASVMVTVVDGAGAPIEDADVSFQTEGLNDFEVCEHSQDGEYVCGYERAGLLQITVDHTAAAEPVEVDVQVDADACHVITEQIEVELALATP